MRVVQVVSGLGWTGGVQEYVAGLSRGLTDLGHEVVILTGGKPPPEGPEPHELARGLDIVFHPKRRIARRYLVPSGLWRSLRRYARWADVVHAHQPFAIGTWMAAATRAPLAVTLYLHPEHVEGAAARRRRAQLALLLRRVDLLVPVSEAEERLVRSIGHARRSGVVWPGLVSRPVPSDRGRQRPLVISVGRLSSTKGLDLTVRAFARLPEGIDVRIIGDGPDAPRVADLCAEVGLDRTEVLVGGELSEHEVAQLMDDAAVFVSASRQESFGIAPMKAIAHGCRAVLSDIPSHREILTTVGADDQLLFDPDTGPAELAHLIEAAVAAGPQPALVAQRVPTWEESARSAVSHYEAMLGQGRPARQRRPESSSTSR